METKYILGIDIGGTSGKAGIYDLSGHELYTAKSSFNQISPHDGWLERDVDEVISAFMNMIKSCVDSNVVSPDDIIGIGITSYTNGAFFIDENGKSAYKNNCILAGDMRSRDLLKKWQADGTVDKIRQFTYQDLFAGQTAAVIPWMKLNHPEVMEKTKYIFSCADYLRFILTGEAAAEVTNGSTVSCVDLNNRCFSKDVFDALGIGDLLCKMPERLLEPSDIAGYITKDIAEITGLIEGTPVMGGIADITSNCIAVGVTDESRMCVTFGTWSINEYISQKPILDKDLFMTSIYPIPGYYLITEGSTTSASNLQWFVDRFMSEEKLRSKADGRSVYDITEEMISSIPYDDSTIIFLPFLYGTNVSLDAKSGFIGINGRHTKAHMLRAVYEGIAFSHLHHIDKLIKFRGGKPDAIRISGGGASSSEWCQMFADMLQIPVEVPEAQELGALGAALCVTVGLGIYENFRDASNSLYKVSKVYYPKEERYSYYSKKYEIYKKLIDALDNTWEEFACVEK